MSSKKFSHLKNEIHNKAAIPNPPIRERYKLQKFNILGFIEIFNTLMENRIKNKFAEGLIYYLQIYNNNDRLKQIFA
jgi:hypothetical protein